MKKNGSSKQFASLQISAALHKRAKRVADSKGMKLYTFIEELISKGVQEVETSGDAAR